MELQTAAGQASPILRELGTELIFRADRQRSFLSNVQTVEVSVEPGAYLVVNRENVSFFEAAHDLKISKEGTHAIIQVGKTGTANTLALLDGVELTVGRNEGIILDQRNFPGPSTLHISDELLRAPGLREKILTIQ